MWRSGVAIRGRRPFWRRRLVYRLEFPDSGDPRIVYLDWMTDSDYLDGLRLEVADLDGGHRAVRDSKNPTGLALIVTPTEWSAFTTAVRAGEFD